VAATIGFGDQTCPACAGTGVKVQKSSLGSKTVSVPLSGKGLTASPAQRRKVQGQCCVVCGVDSSIAPIDPMHVASRAQGGCDDPLCCVPGCRVCHSRYDTGDLDLLPFLEPRYRAELAHALQHLGLVGLYRRVTNERLAA
jgi:hypothetical protein